MNQMPLMEYMSRYDGDEYMFRCSLNARTHNCSSKITVIKLLEKSILIDGKEISKVEYALCGNCEIVDIIRPTSFSEVNKEKQYNHPFFVKSSGYIINKKVSKGYILDEDMYICINKFTNRIMKEKIKKMDKYVPVVYEHINSENIPWLTKY